ncbi:MAG: hypothetical protein DWQ37_05835 [Planctomycetota bacterium]|nr:MAG: hypothetical protein DWQ37_05835 [Planctomycetota bacterium]
MGGDLEFLDDSGKNTKVPMSVVANLKYDEALLAIDQDGRPARSVRYYDDIRAVIKIDQGGEKPSLDPGRRLIVAERGKTGPCVLYCPNEPLRREELELIDVPGSTLAFDGFLPDKPVAIGDTWKVDEEPLAALLCLDAVGKSEVECVLGEVQDGEAIVSAAGSLSGAVGGISTEIELKIKYKFNRQARRIHSFAMLIKEQRAAGHIGPGLDTVAKLVVQVVPIRASQTLTAERLRQVPGSTTEDQLALGYSALGGQFQLAYDRRWHLTNDEPKLAVLRMLDRGELLAQCNVSALPQVKKPVTLAQFQRDVERSLGKNFGQFTAASQQVNDTGYAVFRVVVDGKVSGVPVEWIYYLVQDRQGHRVSLAFTLESGKRERFAAADSAFVSAVRLTEPPAPTAAKPVQTK